MCGINGFRSDHKISDPRALTLKMLRHLRKRGPDGDGFMAVSGGDGTHTWYLGHTRLAIIDLESGKQPMADTGRKVAVTCNGEIYNFGDMQSELIKKGYDFKTRSDTEVLIHGYREWGIEGLLNRIHGMFAFCLVDAEKDVVYLARDPMGQKPLYYSHDPEHGLAFSTSLKAVLEVPWVKPDLDRQGLRLGVSLKYIPAPFTAYVRVKKVVPGHYVSVSEKGISEYRYWNGSSINARSPVDYDNEVALQQLDEVMAECVSECMVSDVPLALLLSSGIDSTLIAAKIAEMGRAYEVPAITVSFSESVFDEGGNAAWLARHLGFRHEKILLEEVSAQEELLTCLELQEEPFSDQSLLPSLVLMRAVRRIAKVGIGGDGGDELFGGYPTFPAIRWQQVINHLRIKRLLRAISIMLPPREIRGYTLRGIIKRFARGLGMRPAQAYVSWLFTAEPSEIIRVLGAGGVGHDFDMNSIFSLTEDIHEEEKIRLMSLQYIRLFLPGILHKVDMASMYNGLEVRAPFLQPAMISLALSLPGKAKIHKKETKFILRELVRRKGLEYQSHLPKRGFNVPLAHWIRGNLKPIMESYLSKELLEQTAFFDASVVDKFWQAHLKGRQDNVDILWSIVTTQKFLIEWGNYPSERIRGRDIT